MLLRRPLKPEKILRSWNGRGSEGRHPRRRALHGKGPGVDRVGHTGPSKCPPRLILRGVKRSLGLESGGERKFQIKAPCCWTPLKGRARPSEVLEQRSRGKARWQVSTTR